MRLSKLSLQRLSTCDPRIQEVIKLAITRTKVDFGVAEGHRSDELQKQYYAEGKSEKDGVTNKSKHQYDPSLAVDIFGWVNGKMCYTVPVMSYLAGVIETCANELNYVIRWGGNWDSDGEILTDQKFNDLPHFEIL